MRVNRRAAVVAILVGLLAGCGTGPGVTPTTAPESSVLGSPSPGTPTPVTATPGQTSASPSAAPTKEPSKPAVACLAEAKRLPQDEQIGQLFMMGVTSGFNATERTLVKRHHLGSVILIGNSLAGSERTKALTDRIGRVTQAYPVIIAVDQEGGLVQRLQGPGFTDMPTAREQARLSDRRLRASAERWGSELRRAGVRVNLAPVADVVPAANVQRNAPVGRLSRGYGSNPSLVGRKVSAYIEGMRAAQVGTSVKHFPGLGRVVGNTDFTANVVDRVTTLDDPGLGSFRAAIRAGVDSVMISTVTYSRIDAKHQAVFSARLIRALRRDFGFDRVLITDDLGAAASMAHVPAASRGVKFLLAGGDLVINAAPALMPAMVRGVRDRARRDPEFAAQVTRSTARVLAWKERLGLAECR